MTILKRAAFPLVMSVLSLVAFGLAYYVLVLDAVVPHRIAALLLLLPFALFAILTVLAAKGRVSPGFGAILTGGLTFLFAFLWVIGLTALSLDDRPVTDPALYDRVLKAGVLPAQLTAQLPASIPDGAEDVSFTYTDDMGGTSLVLKYRASAGEIAACQARFSQAAQWSGSPNEPAAGEWGVFPSDLTVFQDESGQIPDPLTAYLLVGLPQRPGDWNHGQRAVAVICPVQCEILFIAEKW